MNKNGYFSARNITMLAILLALVIVLQTFGGSFNIGIVQFNFTLIPIVLGAILLGATAGAILGLACGVVVTVQVAIGLVPFYTYIWAGSPVIAALTCLIKTTVAGFVAGLAFKMLKNKNVYVAIFVASAIVPVINTALFVLGCICMWSSIVSFMAFAGQTGENIFGFILVFLVSFNFFVELAINLLVAPALWRVVRAVEGTFKSKSDGDADLDIDDGAEENDLVDNNLSEETSLKETDDGGDE